MTTARKICVVTGTRAEYGLLFWLMKEITADPALQLQLIVTGAHLEPKFGHTVDVIEADGLAVDARVPLDLGDDSGSGIAAASAAALAGVSDALARLQPAIVVLLGDRYEILAAATAAMLHRIPIAHIHGGEATEGLIDEAVRHAITKMAHLHFATAEAYRQRIIQMGEQPERVFNFGAPGLDNIDRLTLMNRETLGRDIGLDLSQGYFVVTYHPVTLSDADPALAVDALISALGAFSESKVIITGVNADPGNAVINRSIHAFAEQNPERVKIAGSLGQIRYLSALKHCRAVIGNSSSGLIEAPSFGVPTVNIGERQRGRLKASSVIDCDETRPAIEQAITLAISDQHMQVAKQTTNPYGTAGASARIKDSLAEADLNNILMKRFFDLPVAV